MSIEIKYFRFLDSVTGEVTKNYGYTERHIFVNSVSKIVNDALKVTKYEPVERENLKKPKGEQLEEISKKEFDTLDTSKESFISRLEREKTYLFLKKKQSSKDAEALTQEDFEAKLSQVFEAQGLLKRAE